VKNTKGRIMRNIKFEIELQTLGVNQLRELIKEIKVSLKTFDYYNTKDERIQEIESLKIELNNDVKILNNLKAKQRRGNK
jgi:hypothetical protein